MKSAQTFLKKMETLKELEHITEVIGVVYSRSGFSTTVPPPLLHEHHIAYSDDERWLMEAVCRVSHSKVPT